MDIKEAGRSTGPSRSAISGRAKGALFFLSFGTVWMFVGLKQMNHATRGAVLALGIGSVLLLGLTLLLMRQSRDLPRGNTSAGEEARMQRMFNAVNIIQWVAIGTAIVILDLLHLQEYIVPAIAIIVGLHLFPLASAFGYMQHYVTGILLVLWAVSCLMAVSQERMSGICATGVAAILMLSAASTLLRSFTAMRLATPLAIVARL